MDEINKELTKEWDELRHHKRLVLGIAVVAFFLFTLFGWMAFNWHNSHISYWQYLGNLRVSYKPNSLIYEKYDNNSYILSSRSLIAKATAFKSSCNPSVNPIGSITQINKSALPDSLLGLTADDLHASVPSGNVKEYKDYFLIFNGPQSSCSDNSQVQSQQVKDTQTAHKVFSSVQ